MPTDMIYLRDSYLRETHAVVTRVEGHLVFLDRTIFHPKTGGVDNDIGFILRESDGFRADVVNVLIDRASGDVAHEVSGLPNTLKPGEIVKCVLNWGRRYRLMRLHTASHIIAAIMWREFKALVTGGNVSPDKAYDDYSLETLDKRVFEDVIREANEVVRKSLPVKVYWLPREKALKIPGIVKLESRAPPPNLRELRIVEIPGVDIQADGGPHVRNTSEVGEIVLLKVANKGRRRKRLYFTVRP